MIGVDNFVGFTPALDDRDMQRLLDSLAAGVSVTTVAKVFGVSRRTVYRYREARLETVVVGGYPQTFLVYADRPPVLVTRRNSAKVA